MALMNAPMHTGWRCQLACAFILAMTAGSAQAIISRLTPLRDVIHSEQLIVSTRVEAIDPTQPSALFLVGDVLKGTAPFSKLRVDLSGDLAAQREKQSQQILKRLGLQMPLVLFASQRNERWVAYAYANGTWFQLVGTRLSESGKLSWRFTHCEPYLRRTFKGSTEDLKRAIGDCLSGKKDPPPPVPDEPPGLGPEWKPAKSSRQVPEPALGIIPSFVIIGPLAILAALFPGAAVGLAHVLRRWLVFLEVAGACATVYLAHSFLGGWLPAFLNTPSGLWIILALLSVAGCIWSISRVRGESESLLPLPLERRALALLAALALAALFIALANGRFLLPPGRELIIVSSISLAGAIYAQCLRYWNRMPVAGWPKLTTIMLATQALACTSIAAALIPAHPILTTPRVQWEFTPAEPGAILSSPIHAGQAVYAAAIHGLGFSTFGRVYALDVQTGKELWRFDDGGAMKSVFSTPALAERKIVIGEGLHEDIACKLYCLDAASGRKLWDFQTTSHVESNPRVADGMVFFGAGDDGLYCCDLENGKVRWHFQDSAHIDGGPAVVDRRVYFGSGVSENYANTRVYCLDENSGKIIWNRATSLPVWSTPVVNGSEVFFTLGNGRLDHSATAPAKPAGAVFCLAAQTGNEIWSQALDDAVLMQPVVDDGKVYFGCRNHFAYCIDRRDGRLCWRKDLGSPVVAMPAWQDSALVFAASAGLVTALDRECGESNWSLDVTTIWQLPARIYSAPSVRSEQIVVGAGLEDTLHSRALLFCIKNPKNN
jgi:outer membrane protein assembly factor BamB